MGSDVFSTLPPELQHEIWGQEEHLLAPRSIPICRTLLPFARKAAYTSLIISDDVTLAALGETLRAHSHLGHLIERVEIREKFGEQSNPEDAAWLEESFVAAFEGMTQVKEISIHRTNLADLLTDRIMRSSAFQSAHTLSLSSSEPVAYTTLKYIHHSTSLTTLDIQTPMKYTAGRSAGLFVPGASRISKLSINAEPHSSEFTSFFEHLQLRDLELRSGCTELERIIVALGASTRSTLEKFSFATSGYLQRRIEEDAFSGFRALQFLTLFATQFVITPGFFSSLSHLPLVSVVFRGPPSHPFLRHVIEFVKSDRPETMEEISIDVASVAKVFSSQDIDGNWIHGPREKEALILEDICAKCGVRLEGNIKEALKVIVKPKDREELQKILEPEPALPSPSASLPFYGNASSYF